MIGERVTVTDRLDALAELLTLLSIIGVGVLALYVMAAGQ